MRNQTIRFPLLLIAITCLLLGGWLGLVRMGWALPFVGGPLAHGPLMISGFLGTLIAVERAVALRKWWTYVGPALSALGAVTLLAGVPVAPQILFTLAGLGLVLVFVFIIRQHMASYTLVMGLGAVCWLAGSALWLAGSPVPRVVGWWVAFLVLTVAGERLELSRVRRLSDRGRNLFSVIVGWLLLGLLATTTWPDVGMRLMGAGYILLGGWLLRFDIAGRTIGQEGLPRYVAACLLPGYGWLILSGAIMLAVGFVSAGLYYDVMLHAALIGFTMSMIFGHAPIILPAVLGRQIRYHPILYGPLALLHLSMLLRAAGDLAFWQAGRQWGGMFNGIAVLSLILVFFVLIRDNPNRAAAA